MPKNKKFKVIEKDAKNAPTKDIQWEGEELQATSKTKIEDDKGTGTPIVIRFFEFGANPQAFKEHKPTAQELFNGHRKGLEALLWRDNLRPYEGVEPRLQFSKDKSHYRIILTCIPTSFNTINTQTLSQLLAKPKP